MEHSYWFTSELFEVEKGEDEETNPGCYGKSLANWLCSKLIVLGYDAEVIPEDWGWCIMCVYGDYLLWVGCGAVQTDELEELIEKEKTPLSSNIIWHSFTTIEIPFFMFKSHIRKWSGKLDIRSPLEKLNKDLDNIMQSEPRIVLCDEP